MYCRTLCKIQLHVKFTWKQNQLITSRHKNEQLSHFNNCYCYWHNYYKILREISWILFCKHNNKNHNPLLLHITKVVPRQCCYQVAHQRQLSQQKLSQSGNPQQTHSCLDYFLMLFPPSQLNLIVDLINGELGKNQKKYTTTGEIIKFCCVMILVMHFEFGNHASLWSYTSTHKYIPTPSLGMMGMVHK